MGAIVRLSFHNANRELNSWVIRLGYNKRWAKRTVTTGDVGKRRGGRSRIRWIDSVNEDLKSIGVDKWRGVAIHGDKWRMTVETLTLV